jgi:hypothetical protein
METVIEGRWEGRAGRAAARRPEGVTLVDDAGAVVGTAGYTEVTEVSADRAGRRALLTLRFGHLGAWRLDGMHSLQARFAAELIQEQLSAVHRRGLPLYAQAQPIRSWPPRLTRCSPLPGGGVVDLLDFLLSQAAHHGASDIHWSRFRTSCASASGSMAASLTWWRSRSSGFRACSHA